MQSSLVAARASKTWKPRRPMRELAQHDTFSRFAILACPFLVFRHGVESLDSSTEKMPK